MNLAAARAVADALVGSPSIAIGAPRGKRTRRAYGVLAPRSWSESGGSEAWWLQAQLLVAGDPARIAGELRFRQLERRRLENRWGREVAHSAGHEIVARTIAFDAGVDGEHPIVVPGERVIERAGSCRAVRDRQELTGRIVVVRELVPADRLLERITIRVENTTPWPTSPGVALRDDILASAFAATHLVIGVERGELVSVIDPPPWASGAAASCANVRTYPVLAGPRGTTNIALAAPFIHCDHPQHEA